MKTNRDSWYKGVSAAFLEDEGRHEMGRKRKRELEKHREDVRVGISKEFNLVKKIVKF
jgi:hypothetical protein